MNVIKNKFTLETFSKPGETVRDLIHSASSCESGTQHQAVAVALGSVLSREVLREGQKGISGHEPELEFIKKRF